MSGREVLTILLMVIAFACLLADVKAILRTGRRSRWRSGAPAAMLLAILMEWLP